MKTWLDVTIIKCPHCGHYYADASWYVVEIGSDIECSICHTIFNTKKHAVDRILLELNLNGKEKVDHAQVKKHFRMVFT
jgi:hypothetical protein